MQPPGRDFLIATPSASNSNHVSTRRQATEIYRTHHIFVYARVASSSDILLHVFSLRCILVKRHSDLAWPCSVKRASSCTSWMLTRSLCTPRGRTFKVLDVSMSSFHDSCCQLCTATCRWLPWHAVSDVHEILVCRPYRCLRKTEACRLRFHARRCSLLAI